MNLKEFTIDKISWHSKLDNSPEFQSRLKQRFISVSAFLETHGLLKSPLDTTLIESGGDFAIHSSDLTSEGLQLMKAAYPKWLKSLDRGVDPKDTRLLDREFKKLRQTIES